MTFLKHIASEDGFTIQETLVVMIVGSILISMSLGLFFFAQRLWQTWQRNKELPALVDRVSRRIELDFRESSSLVDLTDSSIVLSKGIGTLVRYRCSGMTVWRNEVAMNDSSEKRMVLSVRPIEKSHQLFSLRVTGRSKTREYIREGIVALPASSVQMFAEGR